MRKNITIEKLMLGGEKVNKPALDRQSGSGEPLIEN